MTDQSKLVTLADSPTADLTRAGGSVKSFASGGLLEGGKPTAAQKEAGNYRKLHTSIHGMRIAIENPAGSERSGTGKDGKRWSVTMPAHYGYIKGSKGNDNDQVDVHVGPHPDRHHVHVVDQIDPDTGAFDEHKALIGFKSRKHALDTYHGSFSDGSGPRRIGAISSMHVSKFKGWLDKGVRRRAMQYSGPVNRANSVPWLAGASDTPSGYPVNIDYRVPKTLTVKGKTFSPDKYLIVHEIVEYHLMQKGMKYEPAHRKALVAEKAAVEADGIDWNGYQDTMHRVAEGLEKAKHPNPPKNLYDKEYPCHLKEALHKEGVRSFAEGGSVDDFTPLSSQELGQMGLSQGSYRGGNTSQGDDDFTPLSDDEVRRMNLPPISGAGAFAVSAARGALPAAAAVPGAVVGSEVGAGIGALGGPAAPFTVPAGAVIGGIGGAMVGGAAIHAAQNWLMEKLGISDKVNELTEAARTQHPNLSLLGELAPNVAAFQPSQIAKGVGSRLLPAALGGGMEAVNEKMNGEDLDPQKLAIAAGGMALLNNPTKLGRSLMGTGERVTAAGMSRLPQATQAAINAGKARAGSYWGGKAQEGQPGRPDLQRALPSPPDFTAGPEGVARYGQGAPEQEVLPPERGLPKPPDFTAGAEGVGPYQPGAQTIDEAGNPLPGTKAEQARPIYERPYKPRPGTSANNTPVGPEEVSAPPKTPETMEQGKREASPGVQGMPPGVAISAAQPAPRLTSELVGNDVNPPAGSQRDYRATADSNVHPTSSGSGNTPSATLGDPARANMSPEIELAMQGKGRSTPSQPQPQPGGERIGFASAGAVRQNRPATSVPRTMDQLPQTEAQEPRGGDPMQHMTDIANANVTDMVAKTRQLGMNRLADAIEANPALADKVRPVLSDPAQLRELSAAVSKAQQQERAQAAIGKMQEGVERRAQEPPFVSESQKTGPSEDNAQRRAGQGQTVETTEGTAVRASERKAQLAKKAADAAQSAFDKFATGKIGAADYSELAARLRAAMAHAAEQNDGRDPLLSPVSKRMMPRDENNPAQERPMGGMIRKRTAAQEWLKSARELVGTPSEPKTVIPSKAVKFLGDERMLLSGAKGKEIRDFNQAETPQTRAQPKQVSNETPQFEDWLGTLSKEDRAKWEDARDEWREDEHEPTQLEQNSDTYHNPEEDRMIDMIDAARAARKSGFLQSAAQFLENEDGSLNLQKVIQSVRGAFGPRAQRTANQALQDEDYYAARGNRGGWSKLSDRQRYGRSLDEGLNQVRNEDETRRIDNLQEAQTHPEDMRNPQTQEDIYFAHEAGKVNTLPQEQQAYYKKYLDPINQRIADTVKKIRALDPDAMGPEVLNHIYRAAKGLARDWGGDPLTNQSPRGLTKTAAMAKDRQFYAIENPNGGRTVISPTKNGYAEWNNGVETFRQNANFEAKAGETFRDHKGVVQTVRDALTPEIEAHARFSNGARAEYYHNAVMSLYETDAYLKDMLNHRLFLKSLDGMTAADGVTKPWKEWTTTDSKEAADRGWKQSNFPQLKGTYMANQLRWVFDDYAGRGFDDASLNSIRDLSERVTKLLFWNPVPHLMNVATHAFAARGWKWIQPDAYRTLAETTSQAINDVRTQTGSVKEYLANGGHLPWSGIIAHESMERIANIFGQTMVKDASKWDPIAHVFGMSTPELARSIYRSSRNIMWAGNDMMVLQHYLEAKANGMSPREAVLDTEKHIPNYRMPTSILTGGSRPDGSEGVGRYLAKVLRDPITFAFGRYHYAIFNSYAHIVKDAIGPNSSPEQRWDAIGKMMAMGMLGFAVYPQLDRMAQWATGNKDAEMHRRGPLAIPGQLWKEGPAAAARGTFTMSPLAATSLETLQNRDWAGRPIIQPGTWDRVKGGPRRGQALGEAAVQEGEHAARGLIAPYGTAAQIADAKRNPVTGLRDQLLDIRNPSPAAVKYQQTAPRKEAAAERSRENRGGHGPAERLYNTLTR